MKDSKATFQLIHQGMLNAGIDANEVYRRLASAGYIACRDGRFRHETHIAFWQVVERITADPAIGLHLCPRLPPFRGRALEYLFLSSANYEQGLINASRYQRLVSDAFQMSLVVDDAGARILIVGAEGDAPELRHTENCTVYAVLRMLATLTDGRLVPRKLCLHVRPRAASREYEQTFDCAVEFDAAATEIWFDPAVLACRSPHSDSEWLKLHRKYADNQLAKLARQDLMDNVYEYLKKQYWACRDGAGPDLTLPDVAGKFGVSARHLRFVLSEAETSFRQLLRDARFGFACGMLRKTDEALEDIAAQAGFSEPSPFYRAFKKWAGRTPEQYREAKRSQRRVPQQAPAANRPGRL